MAGSSDFGLVSIAHVFMEVFHFYRISLTLGIWAQAGIRTALPLRTFLTHLLLPGVSRFSLCRCCQAMTSNARSKIMFREARLDFWSWCCGVAAWLRLDHLGHHPASVRFWQSVRIHPALSCQSPPQPHPVSGPNLLRSRARREPAPKGTCAGHPHRQRQRLTRGFPVPAPE